MREKISFTVSAPEPRNIIKARKTGVNLSYYGSSLWSGCSGTGMFGRGTSVWNFCTSPQAALLGGNHCISFSLVFAFLPLIWVATSQRDRFIYCTEKGKMEILNFQLTAESGANAKVYTNGLSSESVSACLALHYYLRQRRYSTIVLLLLSGLCFPEVIGHLTTSKWSISQLFLQEGQNIAKKPKAEEDVYL